MQVNINTVGRKEEKAMVQIVNPFNRAEEDFVSAANLCDCKCSAALDNHSSGIWTSRLTFNIMCGCKCDDNIPYNYDANSDADKNR